MLNATITRVLVAGLLAVAACRSDKPASDSPKPSPVASAPETPSGKPPADAAATNETPADAPSATTAAPASDEDAAALIYAAASDPAKAGNVSALIPAGAQVKLTERGGGSGKKSFEGVEGFRQAFAAGNATAMKLTACKDRCCEFKPEFDDERALGMQLRKVCFDDKRTLTSVDIAYEN